MPRQTKPKPRRQPPAPEVSHEALCREMAEEARRLRSLAESVRASSESPVLEEYLRAGRGPAYQRDRDKRVKTLHVAYAYDEAASRLEETLASPALRR